MRTTPLVLALLLSLGALLGCSGDGDTAHHTVGTRVTSWTEASDDRDAVHRLDGLPRLISEPAELEALIELASPELDTTDLDDVDLDDVVLVVGAYPRCDEYSGVEVADGGSTLRFTITKPNEDNPIQCSWSPLQVDVWEVPRDDLADDVRLDDAADD